MMQLKLTSPCCLLLGMADIDGRTHQLGVALTYPPIEIEARRSALLLITGGRADLAYRQAERFLEHHGLPRQGEIEIELAIPSFMGLGSAGMLGLSVARTLAELGELPADDAQALASAAGLGADEALETHAFAHGGLLLVDDAGGLARRVPIAHAGEDAAWVWVLVLPRVPSGAVESLEAERRAELRAAARHLGAGRASCEQLFGAAERDDIAAFAAALGEIQQLNDDALRLAETPHPLDDAEARLLAIMRGHGALVCGRALGGLALYGLIQGAGPSRALRRALTAELGFFGGSVIGSVCSPHGATLE